MGNLLLEDIQYKIEQTNFGTWCRYVYPNGTSFREFKSYATLFGLPLLHYTYGRNPETGKRIVAKGIIAIGRLACGLVAIGHASFGLLAIGQLAIGIIFGLGQLSTGLVAAGQAAIAIFFGLGQFATGYIAIAQFGIGKYVLGQVGFGEFVWSVKRADPQAIEFFKMLPIIKLFLF